MSKLSEAYLRHSLRYFQVAERIIDRLGEELTFARDNYYEERSQIDAASKWINRTLNQENPLKSKKALSSLKLYSLTYNLLRVEIAKSHVMELIKRVN